MRNLLYLVVLFSLPAFACPDFTGIYKNCSNLYMKNSKPFQVTIKQRKDGELQIYEWQVYDGKPYVLYADDKERLDKGLGPDKKNLYLVKTTTTCIADKVVSKAIEDYKNVKTTTITTLFKENEKVILRTEHPDSKDQKLVDVVCTLNH